MTPQAANQRQRPPARCGGLSTPCSFFSVASDFFRFWFVHSRSEQTREIPFDSIAVEIAVPSSARNAGGSPLQFEIPNRADSSSPWTTRDRDSRCRRQL